MDLIVGTCHHKQPSWASGGGRMECLPLAEALHRHWDDARHFCTYYVCGTAGERETAWPRLKKHVDDRRVEQAGGSIWVWGLAFDYDRPKVAGEKFPWQSQAEIDELAGKLDGAGLWPTVFYATKHGARMIYVLSRAITPAQAEAAYLVMLDRAAAAGVELDGATKDWTRLFALPFITKDDGGPRLWENPLIHDNLLVSEGVTLDPDPILSEARPVAAAAQAARAAPEGQPTAEEVDRLLYNVNGTKRTQTAFHRQAKERLKNLASVADYLFADKAPDFVAGERDSRLNAMTWTVVKRVWDIDGATPQHVFALLHRTAALIQPDADDPSKDWTSVLWEKVRRIWTSQAEEVQVQKVSVDKQIQRMLTGLSAQCGGNLRRIAAQAGYETDEEYLRRHMIVSVKSELFPMGPDGYYAPTPSDPWSVVGDIQRQGLEDAYDLIDDDGELLPRDTLLRRHSFTAAKACFKVGIRRAQVTDLATSSPVLWLPAYYRHEFPAVYSPNVDEWLHSLFPADGDYEAATRWLALCQEITRPICALSLEGPKGAGKSLLVEMVAAMFGPGQKNSDDVLDPAHNAALKDNPVIHIDEEAPILRGASKGLDAVLRTYVTGGTITLNGKWFVPKQMELFSRIIITANDSDALRRTISGRDLSDESHAALAERVRHVVVDERARETLNRLGNWQTTRNWLRGDCEALKHMAWLYEEHRHLVDACADRLLVAGDENSPLLSSMRFSTDLMEAVLRALLRALERGKESVLQINDGTGEVRVTTHALFEYMRSTLDYEFRNLKLSLVGVGRALSKIRGNRMSDKKNLRTWAINLTPLVLFAERHGIECPLLRRLHATATTIAPLQGVSQEAA